MGVASHIKAKISSASFIRKAFEIGNQLKKRYGAENVFDFSIGNPNLEPPEAFEEALLEAVKERRPLKHGYMPNAGYADVRSAIAQNASKEYSTPFTENNIIMTCGAGGALNCIIKTLVNPGDSILGAAPYFVEYPFYATNHGGTFVPVASTSDFNLDIEAFARAMTPTTAAVLINSPNNPTGKIYPESTIRELGRLLEAKSREFDRTIYLIADEPYRKIVFDKAVVPSIFTCYDNSILATSYSKDLSLPGERIGYIAVGSRAQDSEELINGIILCNRILGYVNAPALMQKAVKAVQGISCDMTLYIRNRNVFCEGLLSLGYELVKPDGAFYLFPKAPGGDDLAFTALLQEERVLAVPGSGFGTPGYFRLAFCCATETIARSMPSFERAIRRIHT